MSIHAEFAETYGEEVAAKLIRAGGKLAPGAALDGLDAYRDGDLDRALLWCLYELIFFNAWQRYGYEPVLDKRSVYAFLWLRRHAILGIEMLYPSTLGLFAGHLNFMKSDVMPAEMASTEGSRT